MNGIKLRQVAEKHIPAEFADILSPILESLKQALLQRGLRPIAIEFEHLNSDEDVIGKCARCQGAGLRVEMIRQVNDVNEYHIKCYAEKYRLK